MRRNTPSFGRAKQKGFTLIELVIGLIIGIVIVAIAIAGIGNATSKSDVSGDIQGVSQLYANVKSLRGNGGYGTSGTNLVPALIAMNAVPKTINNDGTNLTNAWNGAITVTSTGVGYSVSSAGLPKEACIEEGAKLSRGAGTTKIGTTTVTGEVSTIAATTSCSAATNTVVWSSTN